MGDIIVCEEEITGIKYEFDIDVNDYVAQIHLENKSKKFNGIIKFYNSKNNIYGTAYYYIKRNESKILNLKQSFIVSTKYTSSDYFILTYIFTDKKITNIIEANKEFYIKLGFIYRIYLKDQYPIFLARSTQLISRFTILKNEEKKKEWNSRNFMTKKKEAVIYQPYYNTISYLNNLKNNSIEKIENKSLLEINKYGIANIKSTQIEVIDNFIYYKNYKLGYGSFGEVYYGSNVSNSCEFAIKVQIKGTDDDKIDTLLREVRYLENLDDVKGFPKKYFFGKGISIESPYILVESLLGPSLDKLLKFNGKNFSINTIANIGIQMIKRIKDLHNNRIIHRDIKPNNFVWGNFSNKISNLNLKTIYLIDFGLSDTYCNELNEHVEYSSGNNFVGTLRYASLNAHLGIKMSRRDDIESIIYVLIFLYKGNLPWQGVKAKTKNERMNAIKNIKFNTSIDELTKDLPKTFNDILKMTKHLKYKECPNYYYYLYKFALLKNSFGFEYEWIDEILNPVNKSKVEELYQGYPFIYNRYMEYVQTKFQRFNY